ncbi:CBS domain-containing protein [Nitrosopumilus sp.]|uniref:CBS domain-containing protein n=1 Tax=Nitrosopumilus sp. TaxID=2024843 RepID=UPI00247B4C38|nr:CBS domain-containing protein [Nitrosopumilus sp.]MCV0409391.1 CBS domain-containing protein [Nitrosopumilus sp.]
MSQNIPIAERTLGELLPERLTWSLCIHTNKGTEVWVVTGMLVQYLESATDSIIVRDEKENPIGTIGGKEIMANLLKNPTSSLFYGTNVEDIMEPNLVTVSKDTKYKDLMNFWKERGRAYAIIPNEWGFYSAISAQKVLEIGKKCRTNLTIEDLPKKKLVTFRKGDTFGDLINSMFDNKARKILLEGTNKYLSDRLIIEAISEKMKHLTETDDFLNESADIVELEEAKVVSDNLKIDELSKMMYDMVHPCIMYKDWLVTPWDICNVLLSEKITKYVVK